MNILINTNRPVQDQLEEENKKLDRNSTFGERLAASILLIYTTSALIISGWSAILIHSGNIKSGGPIGLFIQMLKTTGIV